MDVGVDTGGTFTDVIRRDPDGELHVYKLLSTPEDPSKAIGDGVDGVVEEGEDYQIVHGTTVATNALLERDGAALAFVTTDGFEDLLTLQRQNRLGLYDLHVQRAEPLVRPDDSFGIEERLANDGSVVQPIDDDALEALVDRIGGGSYEAVAICLLHAYANARHEGRVAEAIGEAHPDLQVSVSSEVVGEFREYERASTTCVNAYVAPVMARYLRRLESRVDTEEIQVLESSGGRVGIERAANYPVHTVLSGPAGGVVGAKTAATEAGIDRLISFDMGGTSTDVSLCDGELAVTSEAEIDGLPIRAPVIDIHTVGAGGGSIARVDPGGVLRVGPESAGADPGPACYGKGGEAPTVTDAHVVLGRIRPGHFLGGRMQLERDRSVEAVGSLAESLGLDLDRTARGILDVADAAMIRALKVISLERGHDPRDFCLVSFGGAGGLHACRLARSLDMRRVLVPRNPGLLSAYGMLHADFQRLVTRTILRPLDDAIGAPDELGDILLEMRESAIGDLTVTSEEFELTWEAQLRYEGQSYELSIPVDWSIGSSRFADPSEAFEREHERLYGYRAEDRNIELVGLRLTASRPGPEPSACRHSADERDGSRTPETAEVGFADGDFPTDILDRGELADGECIEGPAVVTEYSGTTVVPPGWRGEQRSGHIVLEWREE